MADKKISQLTAATLPLAAASLFETSVPDGGGNYLSRSVRYDGLKFTLGATSVTLGATIASVTSLTLGAGSVWSGDTIATTRGGTGQTSYADGEMLVGRSSDGSLAKTTLTAGSNITITNGAGTVTIATAAGVGAPGGSSGSLQYNNAGSFGGIAPLTNGQLAIGSTGVAPVPATLTAPAAGFSITAGAGSITFALTGDLAAVEALATTGITARTAASTWATRTITGTANRLTVTNGDGVAGNPTLDLSTSYVGQATITTLGTVATGTWNATVITGQYGGTGVANTGKTITLGGSLVTSGAFGTTITVTATTNSTLPAGTHTLAGLDVIQTWSANQSFNSGNFILKGATSGTLTVIPAAVAGTNTLTLPAGTTDFSATGGAGQFVKQASAGAAFTVSAPTIAEVAGLGAGVATFLATPSSANLAAAVTGETGTGALVFGTSPTLSDPVLPNFTVSTAPLSKTNDTFEDVTGLAVVLAAGRTYSIRGHLTITSSGAAGGIKVTLAASGGLTATSVIFTAANFNGTTTNARSTDTTLGNAVGAATAEVTDIEIVGAIVVNAGGTLSVQAAQNVTDATATVVGINSTFECVRVN